MKSIVIACVFTLSCSVVFAQDTAVRFFEGTLEQAAAKAKAEGKKIFIDVYTDWCKPCKAVDKYVFSTDTAARYFNENFINLKVDAEKDNGPDFLKAFDVEVFPTFIILDDDKTLLTRWMGASMRPTAASFIER